MRFHCKFGRLENGGSFEYLVQFLRRHFIEPTNILGFNKTLRYREGIIEIGEIITAAGIAKWKNFSEPIPGYPYSRIAELDNTDKHKLIITDLPEALS